MNASKETWYAWLSCAGLPAETMRDILREEPDPQRVFTFFQSEGGLPGAEALPRGTLQALRHAGDEKMLSRWEKLISEHGIHTVSYLEPEFPEMLQPLPDAPALLFYQGDLRALLQPSISMVGSRSASYKGLEATGRIAENLSRCGISIVSGLAYGIDAAAHQGCLKGGSPTVAVLGCGLDQDYPVENAGLKRSILQHGGVVLSEYAPGEKPLGWHFPYRNRIISGLSDALVVMEARIRSGSMTTVQHALNQGKDVFVYPGDPGSPRSEGNHQLLREGAIYFTTADDILEDMGWLDKKKNVGQNSEAPSSPNLSDPEQRILRQLDQGERGFDQLCDGTKLSAAQLSAALSMLQVQGLIEALPGKLYRKMKE